ncbi:cell division protein FtsK, partial [Aeromonas hydrophila]
RAKGKNQKGSKEEWLPELDDDTFEFDPQFDDEDDEPAPVVKAKRPAPASSRRQSALAVADDEDDEDLDLPWAEGEDAPVAPVVAMPTKPK